MGKKKVTKWSIKFVLLFNVSEHRGESVGSGPRLPAFLSSEHQSLHWAHSSASLVLVLTLLGLVLRQCLLPKAALIIRRMKQSGSSVAQSRPTLCDPMDCSTPGFHVHHQLLEIAQTHVYRVGDAIQPSHPLSFPSSSAFKLSQHQGLFQWVSSLHQVAKVLEFQLQHQFFQWIFITDFL